MQFRKKYALVSFWNTLKTVRVRTRKINAICTPFKTIVNRREGLEIKLIRMPEQGHRHVCIVFLPNPPTTILELLNCLSHEWLTFLNVTIG